MQVSCGKYVCDTKFEWCTKRMIVMLKSIIMLNIHAREHLSTNKIFNSSFAKYSTSKSNQTNMWLLSIPNLACLPTGHEKKNYGREKEDKLKVYLIFTLASPTLTNFFLVILRIPALYPPTWAF